MPLQDVAPWIDDRAAELRPFYLLAAATDPDELLRLEREYRHQQASKLPTPALKRLADTIELLNAKFREDHLRETISLARCLGPAGFEAVCEMVFDFDEFTLMAGTPDLLVWTPHPQEPHWFFAEVKAPGDHLQPSQVDWLRANWTALEGRFALIQLCSDA